ncbi:MAG: hypothetical protein CMJ83_00365 [Planctomycetes bacterium]|nr:hypothetical protein [Planctomycetota bacterium]
MRHLALVFGIAGLLIVGWQLMATGPGASSGSLRGVGRDDPSTFEAAAVGVGATQSRPRWPGAQTTISRKAGLVGLCEDRGVVGDAVYDLIKQTVGQDVRTLDRSFSSKHIARILAEWHYQPQRKSKDIDFLVAVWNLVKDPTARYALSYLFRRVQDDRVIEPLMELTEHHPWQTIDAIADQNSNRAAQALLQLQSRIDKPAVRTQATIRIARMGREGAVDHLDRTWNDRSLSDTERFVAVECLGHVPDNPEATLKAYEIALGPAHPLRDLGDRNRDHPVRDLRSAAVMAVMQAGDQTLVRKLLAAADEPQAQAALTSMVDLHIGTYVGSDLSRVVFDRIGRRQTVSLGEVRYLNRACTRRDLDQLRGILRHAKSDEIKRMVEAAIMNASRRE